MSRLAAAVLFCLGAGLALTGSARAQNAFVKSVPPCGTEANQFYCKTFKPGDAPASVRDIAVNFPAKGVAMVSFIGSLWCEGKFEGDSLVYRMDLQLRADSLPPQQNGGAGGLGIGAYSVSWGRVEKAQQTPVTVLRPFNVNAGTARVFRLMAALRYNDQNLVQCNINGGQMTVTFTPAP